MPRGCRGWRGAAAPRRCYTRGGGGISIGSLLNPIEKKRHLESALLVAIFGIIEWENDGLTGSKLCQCPQVCSLTPYLCPSVHFAWQLLSRRSRLLFLQELVEVVDAVERIRMPIAEGLALPLQRLA